MIELRYLRPGRRHVLHVVTPVALVLSGSLLAGCSASITRFDNPSFALNDSETGSVSRGSDNGYGGSNLSDRSPSPDYGRSYTGPVTSTGSSVRSSQLPDIQQQQDSYRDQSPSYASSRDYTRSADAGYRPADRYDSGSYRSGHNDGQTIVVRSGDTLYSLSRRHNTTVSELMAANGLTSSHLQLGQRLTIPSSGASHAPSRPEYAASPAPARARTYQESSYETPSYQAPSYEEPAASQTARSDWNGTYQVASGDSLYGIARRHGVTSDELQRHNGISDPRRVMPGTVLRVPGGGGGNSYAAAEEPATSGYQPTPGPQRVAALQNYSRNDAGEPAPAARGPVTERNQFTQTRNVRTVAISPALQNSNAANSAAPANFGGKLRWPVRGRVIENFGPRKDGTHNDGVNLAVPMGSEVHAAEDGVVAYAGSELRGYGNLILLRHDNGWVTAYAHNENISVKRGDKVTRGQVIATAGKTGEVDQPQVHFELRMGSKPVDPLPYLETL